MFYALCRMHVSGIDTLVKSPDAALRFILSLCGVQQVRLIPSDACKQVSKDRARLACELFTSVPENAHLLTFYDIITVNALCRKEVP
jgi:hypothetical protein